MSTKNDQTRPTVDVMPPEEKSRKPAVRDRPGHLPEIRLPPAGIIRSALFTAIRYNTTKRALSAYHGSIEEAVKITDALSDLDVAHMDRQRSIRLLEDAETVHKADADLRSMNALKAEQKFKDAEADAEISDMERERKLHTAQEKHRDWEQKKQKGGVETVIILGDLTTEEEEFAIQLKGMSQEDRWQTEEARLREVAKAVIAEIVEEHGGEKNLTPKARERIETIRQQAEQLIQERKPA